VKNARAEVASIPLAVGRSSGSIGDYIALTKPRLNALVVATGAAGYYLGSLREPELLQMTHAVAAVALVAGGAAALNQVYERDTDALMRRTRMRPLPDGRLAPADARTFGLVLAGAGLALLALGANEVILTGLIAAGMGEVLAQAIAIALVTPINFVGNKLWSFRRR